MKKILEICCFDLTSAIAAEEAGADRVELCSDYSVGGTTPSFGTIQCAVDQLNIPVHVLVRPRGGNFTYSATEFEVIKKEIEVIKQIGAAGVVIGFLNEEYEIDLEMTSIAIELAGSMSVTFHRAFDVCHDPILALDKLKACGVDRILTSGQQSAALDGADLIARLVDQAEDQLTIIAGGGITSDNLSALQTRTGCHEFHSSARKRNPQVLKIQNSEVHFPEHISADPSEVQRMAMILGKL